MLSQSISTSYATSYFSSKSCLIAIHPTFLTRAIVLSNLIQERNNFQTYPKWKWVNSVDVAINVFPDNAQDINMSSTMFRKSWCQLQDQVIFTTTCHHHVQHPWKSTQNCYPHLQYLHIPADIRIFCYGHCDFLVGHKKQFSSSTCTSAITNKVLLYFSIHLWLFIEKLGLFPT